jgi:putative DNA primase/helicase
MKKRQDWNFHNIPPELTQLKQWVNWKYFFDKKRDKWTKPPCYAAGKNMDPHKPGNWLAFEEAKTAFKKNKHLAGVGIVLTHDLGLVGIDLDHCMKNGTLEPWAAEIVHKVGSYAEISPSGEGIRIFVLGRLPGGIDGRKRGKVEMYASGRYLTVTGNALPCEKGAP